MRYTPRTLGAADLETTGAWIAGHQRPDGAIPWFPGQMMDPWNHVQCAMALAVTGRHAAAEAAFRHLAARQGPDGAWPAAATATAVLNPARETNHAAYVATGLWHLHLARPDRGFLAETWPMVERAIAFVLRHQDESGAIAWAVDGRGVVWPAPLLTGSASMHGSLVAALRIAATLGHARPAWARARERLAAAVASDHVVFATGPEPRGRHAMDWYYPVLGGALRGAAARERLLRGREAFIGEGAGCRCVREEPWYTAAETCELVLALDACGLGDRARELFRWVQTLREPDGGYWTGIRYPQNLFWPTQRPAWTAATVVLAADALGARSPTSGFFRDLGAAQ